MTEVLALIIVGWAVAGASGLWWLSNLVDLNFLPSSVADSFLLMLYFVLSMLLGPIMFILCLYEFLRSRTM